MENLKATAKAKELLESVADWFYLSMIRSAMLNFFSYSKDSLPTISKEDSSDSSSVVQNSMLPGVTAPLEKKDTHLSVQKPVGIAACVMGNTEIAPHIFSSYMSREVLAAQKIKEKERVERKEQEQLDALIAQECASQEEHFFEEILIHEKAHMLLSVVEFARETALSHDQMLLQLDENQLDKDQLAVLNVVYSEGDEGEDLYQSLTDSQKKLADAFLLLLE
jgi:hypothetical protein